MLRPMLLASFLAFATSAYLSESWAMLSGRPNQPQCVEIPRNFTLCHGIDYDQMRLPNLLEHETMNEVIQQSLSWVPLLRLNCHPDAQLFLCSLFAPVCLSVDKPIYPCRSLCLEVQNECEKRMQMYGFPWPEMLSCNKYPVHTDMCIQPRANYRNQTCIACSQVGTYENILDHFCRSQYVAKVKVQSTAASFFTVKGGRSLKPNGRRQSRSERVLRNQVVYFSDDNRTCPCNVVPKEKTRKRRYLLMADTNTNGEVVANLILPWKRERQLRRAVRMFRRLRCEQLGQQIRDRARRLSPPNQENYGRRIRT